MSHQAIYRQWRPKTFGDVLGQDAVIATLKNQISSGNIAHAYLFSGIRGTGKTSTARILARALNCIAPNQNEPCNKCEFCEAILAETMMDVVEIDAASNNGVDDIRQLRETIKYPPAQTKYKIYIIDEVHMLSQGAFNALLKTLEEPPEYAVFILATTEPQKIPATILSRCQRYDFKSIPREIIVDHLNKICKSLDINADKNALELISDNSGGALRDAQSLLEQSIASIDNNLKYDDVLSILGMMNEAFFNEFVDKIFKSDIAGVLESLEQFIIDGGRIDTLIQRMLDYYRYMIFIKSNVDVSSYKSVVMDVDDEIVNRVKALSIETILWSMELLGDLSTQIKWMSQPRIHFEMLLIKLMVPKMDKSADAIYARLDKLESNASTNFSEIKIDTSKNKVKNIISEELHDEHEIITEDVEISNVEVESKQRIDYVDGANIDFGIIKSQWESILNQIRNEKVQVHALLIEGILNSFEKNELIIKFEPEYTFHVNMLSEPKNIDVIQKVLKSRFSTEIVVKFICEENNVKQKTSDMAFISDEDRVKDYLGKYSDKLKIK